MKVVYYIPIYTWGEDDNSVNGVASGTTIYCELKDLYGFEPDAIGHMELSGTTPTKNEFDLKNKI